MPHGKTGTKHHCGGDKAPVSMPARRGREPFVIPAGNCVYVKNPRRCTTHENYCPTHDWIFKKNQGCRKCQAEQDRRRVEDAKRKKDEEDEDKAGPSKGKGKRAKGKGKGKETTKNTKKTIAKKSKGKKAADTKKAIAIFQTLERWMTGVKKIDLDQLRSSDKQIVFPDPFELEEPVSVTPIVVAHAIAPFLYDEHGLNFTQKAFLDKFTPPEQTLRLWLTGVKTIDLEQLKKSDKDVLLSIGANDGIMDTCSVQPIAVLNAIAPFLHDEHGLNFTQNASIAVMDKMKSQELHRYHLRPRERVYGPDTDTDSNSDSGYGSYNYSSESESVDSNTDPGNNNCAMG